MEKQNSMKLFTAFVESLQALCNRFLDYDSFVEVSGYLSVEIDNVTKERYVLSEILQSNGNVVSESFCVKAYNALVEASAGFEPRTRSSSSFNACRVEAVNHRRHASTSGQRLQCRYDESRMHKELVPLDTSQDEVNMKVKSSYAGREQQPACGRSTHGQLKRHADDGGFTNIHQQKVRLPSRTEGSYLQPASPPPTVYLDNIEDEDYQVEEVPIRNIPNVMNKHVSERPLGEEEVSTRMSLASDEVIDLDLFDGGETSTTFPVGPVMSSQDSYLNVLPYRDGGNAPVVMKTGESRMSPGSVSVMKSSIKQFRKYHFEKDRTEVDLLSTAPEELNEMLLNFYQGARTIHDRPLSHGSMKNVQIYIDKYLREKGYLYSISKDDFFKTSREYIKSQMNETYRPLQGPKHLPVNDEDIEVLFITKQMGDFTPDSVINAMWVLNSKFFAIRGPSEHFKFRWGDIALRVDNLGNEYLEYLGKSMPSFTLKVHAKPEEPSKCFVHIYKMYMSVRPKLMLDADSAFYLKPQRTSTRALDAWYSPEPLSWSSLIGLWKRMLASAGLPMNKRIF